jgi:hypothetical protein
MGGGVAAGGLKGGQPTPRVSTFNADSKIANDGDHTFPEKHMAKKTKRKSKPRAAKKQAYEYLAERLHTNGAEAPGGDEAIVARMNELGAQGWRLVCMADPFAWFMRSI